MTHSIHANTMLGKVKLNISDLERSIQFYLNVLGFKLLRREAHVAYLTVDGVEPLLILEEVQHAPVLPRRAHTGLYHFAILVPSREQLGLVLRNMIKAGIQIGQGDHYVSEALYIEDPDRNGIEIYRDRPRDTWRLDANNNIVMGTDPVDIEGLLQEAGDKPWTGLAAGTIVGHIHLHVADLRQAKAFYCDVLGFDVVADMSRAMGALFISAGGYHHHIGLNIWAGVGAPQPPAGSTGLVYYEIALPSAEALEQTLGRLRDAGVEVAQQSEAWIVHDPFGIEIRLMLAA